MVSNITATGSIFKPTITITIMSLQGTTCLSGLGMTDAFNCSKYVGHSLNSTNYTDNSFRSPKFMNRMCFEMGTAFRREDVSVFLIRHHICLHENSAWQLLYGSHISQCAGGEVIV
jgi:hypothetical protein